MPDAARQDQSDFPEWIDPKEAGEIDGIVRGFSEAPTKFGSSVVVELELPGNERRSLWLTATVLRSQFAQVRPKIGERVHVAYLGLRDGAGGSYHNFRVTAPDRPAFVPDWGRLVGDEYGDDYSSGTPLEPTEGELRLAVGDEP